MFFVQMGLMFFGICIFLIFMLESCIVESCLPEFKGTYDEDQDDIIAVDWAGSNEQPQIDVDFSLNSE
jgi:hypothetical protein